MLKHCSGQPTSHAEAKELLAGFAGAFIDREIEPRAENAYDRHKIQRDAVQQCQQNGLDQDYNQGGGYGQDQNYNQGGGYGQDQNY